MIPAIFFLTYLGVAMGGFPRLAIDRTGIALLGAIAMVLLRALTPEEAMAAIHVPTLLLLYGLMIVSAQLRLGGFYTWLALKITRWIDQPRRFLLLLMLTSGMLAAILANDMICLAFTPVLCVAIRKRQLNPLPFLLGLAMATNLGSAATLIGNPQSMLIAQVFGLEFAAFVRWCAPPALLGLFAAYGVLLLCFRNRWAAPAPPRALAEPDWPAFHPWQSGKGLAAVAVVMTLFLLNQPRALSVLTVAGALLLSRRMHTRPMLALVDWHLLTLFCGLFVVVKALTLSGIPGAAMQALAAGNVSFDNPYTLSVLALLFSNLVSNVPATLLLLEPLREAAPETAYVLSLSATFAGNLFLVGSLANFIVLEQAKPYGVEIRFRDYARAGLPVTLVNFAILFSWIRLQSSV